ncbi:MAG: hypothetical protein R3B93_00255 [Bacteroidia bacterium]
MIIASLNGKSNFLKFSIRFSQIAPAQLLTPSLWIDNIGMLSRLYHYWRSSVALDGWGSGLHNILEAVAFGLPVIFGPQIQNFRHIRIDRYGRWISRVSNQDELTRKVKTLIEDKQLRESITVKIRLRRKS